MKYFRSVDNETNINRIIYHEFDEEYYCLRAIFEENNKLETTNFINNKYILPEGSFYEIKDDLGEKITEKEFENKWKTALYPFVENWNKIKKKYIIGNNIKVKINCFYPQGIILDINEIFYGIANYQECKEKYGSGHLYPKHDMEMKIIGYDEKNMWIKLSIN